MSIDTKFEDFSSWPEHLKPVRLEKVPVGPGAVVEAIYAVLAQVGSGVTTAALQNTLKVYGIEGATSVMTGEYERTARIVQTLHEEGIDSLSLSQATILIYNTVSKLVDDPQSAVLASLFYEGRESMTPRQLYDALSVPEKRHLSKGIDAKKLPALCAALKDAPEYIGTGDLQKKYALTRLSTAPSCRKRNPHYIEARRY